MDNIFENRPADITDITHLSKLSKLQLLHLGGWKLDKLPTEIMNLTNLTNLQLANNTIKKLNESILWNLTNLTKLDLSHNEIKSLYLRELDHLITLIANNNEIYHVSLNGNIEEINLKNNKISSLDQFNLTRLKKLYLDNNVICGMSQTIVGNEYKYIKGQIFYNENMTNLLDLEELTLTHNQIDDNNFEVLINRLPLNLKKLDFLNNGIQTLPDNRTRLTNIKDSDIDTQFLYR